MYEAGSKERRGIISNSDIPFVRLRDDYGWVTKNYIPSQKLKAEKRKLERELKEVRAANPDAAALRARVRAGYEAYVERLAAQWARRLWRSAKANDPLMRVERCISLERLDYIPWEILDRALKVIETYDHDGIADKERAKAITTFEKQIAAIDAQIAEAVPEEFFHNGMNTLEVFVDSWRQLQSGTADPVAINGKTLDLSSPEEKAAYEALKLGLVVNGKARLRAWRPE